MRTGRALSSGPAMAIAATLLLPAVPAHGGPTCPERPSARGYAQMVYDSATGTAYIFGGIDQATPNLDYPLFDVWSYNTVTRRWTMLLNDPGLYNAFQRDAVALDPESRKVVLYSTFVNCNWKHRWYCGVETWLYDLGTNTFENVTSGTEPPLRWGSRMVYDTGSRRAILFGGSDGYTSETLNDTWAYDFASNTWTRMFPGESPPPHHFAAMAYHPRADRTVLFGGYDIYADTVRNDTWAYDYDTNTWTDLAPTDPPPPRLYHALAWDRWSNDLILFGGVSYPYEPVLDDTWAFDLTGNTWTPLAPQASPSARAWHAMVGTREGVLLFGGSPVHSPFTDDDTWVFDAPANRWKEVRPCRKPEPTESAR